MGRSVPCTSGCPPFLPKFFSKNLDFREQVNVGWGLGYRKKHSGKLYTGTLGKPSEGAYAPKKYTASATITF